LQKQISITTQLTFPLDHRSAGKSGDGRAFAKFALQIENAAMQFDERFVSASLIRS